MTAVQVTRWQALLDREFPDGIIATWAGDEDSPVYQIPRATVTGTSGLDPQVWLPDWGPADKTLGPLRILHFSVTQRNPCVVASVVPDNAPKMEWSSGVSPLLAKRMAPMRQLYVRLSPHGGSAALIGTRKAG